MSDETKIEWATATFNPWIGCTKVSPGCAHCYAENTTRARVLRSQGHETWGKGKARSRTSAATWRNPLKWNRQLQKYPFACPQCGNGGDQRMPTCFRCGALRGTNPNRFRVFPSLCDWLDDEVPIEWLADFLKLTKDCQHLDWLLLTKRPENWESRIIKAHESLEPVAYNLPMSAMLVNWCGGKPPANIWIGTSVEDQKRADERIPELLKIPAKVRFLSVEPLLGPVDLGFKGSTDVKFPADFKDRTEKQRDDWIAQTARATYIARCDNGIHWVIVGGESGPGARPCNVEWIRDIVRQCKAAGVPCFVKQLGSVPIADDVNSVGFKWTKRDCKTGLWSLKTKHPKGGDPAEWPEDLRVREFPTVCQEQSRSSAPQS